MMFKFTCPQCGTVFTGSTSRSARACRDRHRRESHGKVATRLYHIVNRQARDREYQVAARGPAKAAPSSKSRVVVLCPERRERSHGMFTETRKSFIEIGAPLDSVSRIDGFDCEIDDVPRHQVVMKAFVESFMQVAANIFDESPSVECVFFAEDNSVESKRSCRVEKFWCRHSGLLCFLSPRKGFTVRKDSLFQHLFTTSAHLYARSPWRFTMSVRPCTKQTL